MGRQQFEELLRERRQKSQSKDRASQRTRWVASVAELYTQVEAYLRRYTESGEITVSRQSKEITEEYLGAYSVEQQIIAIGNEHIVLDPIGAMIVGAFGRVDAKGTAGHAQLLLVRRSVTHPRLEPAEADQQSDRSALTGDETDELTWKIATEPPNITYIELTEETFFDLMVELLGGTAPF
jgi:hypothetical protein